MLGQEARAGDVLARSEEAIRALGVQRSSLDASPENGAFDVLTYFRSRGLVVPEAQWQCAFAKQVGARFFGDFILEQVVSKTHFLRQPGGVA